jgi:hypothetical protein
MIRTFFSKRKNFYKCHNVPPTTTVIKNKKTKNKQKPTYLPLPLLYATTSKKRTGFYDMIGTVLRPITPTTVLPGQYKTLPLEPVKTRLCAPKLFSYNYTSQNLLWP